mmetsp:Transcript_11161/g.23710  ORF Transcript_11161/g.23710 Transcript_11161/m.23710 type:complete len:221 (-) Transcript_11161:175-837(-)
MGLPDFSSNCLRYSEAKASSSSICELAEDRKEESINSPPEASVEIFTGVGVSVSEISMLSMTIIGGRTLAYTLNPSLSILVADDSLLVVSSLIGETRGLPITGIFFRCFGTCSSLLLLLSLVPPSIFGTSSSSPEFLLLVSVMFRFNVDISFAKADRLSPPLASLLKSALEDWRLEFENRPSPSLLSATILLLLSLFWIPAAMGVADIPPNWVRSVCCCS